MAPHAKIKSEIKKTHRLRLKAKSMTDETLGDMLNATPPVAEDKKIETPPEGSQEQVPSQNPLDDELSKIKEKSESRTKLEKLEYTKKRVESQLEEERKKLGVVIAPSGDDDEPLTLGKYRQIKQEEAQQTAIQMADDIQDEKERELVKHHLSNTIKPTGNPNEDLRLARMLTNSVRNSTIIKESNRKGEPQSYRGSSAPAPYEPTFEPTPEEAQMMSMKGLDGKPLLNIQDILKARK
jgi:hypothetical protein